MFQVLAGTQPPPTPSKPGRVPQAREDVRSMLSGSSPFFLWHIIWFVQNTCFITWERKTLAELLELWRLSPAVSKGFWTQILLRFYNPELWKPLCVFSRCRSVMDCHSKMFLWQGDFLPELGVNYEVGNLGASRRLSYFIFIYSTSYSPSPFSTFSHFTLPNTWGKAGNMVFPCLADKTQNTSWQVTTRIPPAKTLPVPQAPCGPDMSPPAVSGDAGLSSFTEVLHVTDRNPRPSVNCTSSVS